MDTNRPEAGTGVGPQIPRRALDASLRERRREQRTTMTRVVCFSMGPENVGVVTDICSSGMGLRADLPMDAARDVSFSLMVDGLRLRGSAEIVWMDQARKSCGLRFTSVTPFLRLRINNWIGDSQSGLPNDAEPRFGAEPELTIAEAAQTGVTEAPAANRPVRDTFLIDDWAKQEREASAARSRAFVGGLATGLFLAVVVAGVFFYLGLATWERTPALAKLPAVSLSPASVPPSSVPSGRPGTASADVPTAPLSPSPASPPALAADSLPRQQDASAAPLRAPANGQSPNVQERASSGSPVAASRESALDEADADLRTGHSQEAAALLWSAVSTGNTMAETKLADLYLLGKGVAKSCAQGRVLLTAAAEKGNADAQHRLSSLLRTGCR